MPSISRSSFLAAAATLLFVASPLPTFAHPLPAGPNDPGLCRVPATQAAGVSLRIAPVDDHSEFREGEVIALTADYSTGSAGTYLINLVDATDGEAMGNLEVVCISPDAEGLATSANGTSLIYSSGVDLMDHPKQFTVDVNVWHTLKAGTYSVHVESRRVSMGDDAPPEAIQEPVLVSNAIQIRVVEASMQLRVAYESSGTGGGCETQPQLLRYFLRVKPEYGVAQVRATEKDAASCVDLFPELGSEVSRPEIEKLAIADLWSKTSARVHNAATALGDYGSTQAEHALYTRLDDFRKTREASPKRDGDGDDPSIDVVHGSERLESDSSVEFTVLTALLGGTNWYLGEGELRSLEAVVSDVNAPYVQSALQNEWPAHIYFLGLYWDRAKMSWRLGRFTGPGMDSLKVKLAQLPPGTRIFAHVGAEEMAAHADAFSALDDAAYSAGVRLDSYATVRGRRELMASTSH